jgi:diadenosine tetraphosphate (Ap4A) HIT family hydrolase
VDRLDGGHIRISPKKAYEDRTQLPPREAIEMVRLTMVVGTAMKAGLAKQGIELGRINYQDNGNWKPHLHVHLYGRAKDAKYQKFGDPIIPGHRDEYQPLSEQDIALIKAEIESLMATEAFSSAAWFRFDA